MRNQFLVLLPFILSVAACGSDAPSKPELEMSLEVFLCQTKVLLPYVESLPEAEDLVRRVISGDVSPAELGDEVHDVEASLLACSAPDAGTDAGE